MLEEQALEMYCGSFFMCVGGDSAHTTVCMLRSEDSYLRLGPFLLSVGPGMEVRSLVLAAKAFTCFLSLDHSFETISF